MHAAPFCFHRSCSLQAFSIPLLMLNAGPVLASGVLYVDDDAPAGGDGASWASSYRFLQDALSHAAGSGGAIVEIRIAQGTHEPDRSEAAPGGTGDRTATFTLESGVTLAGGYAGIGAPDPDARDVASFVTTLSGDLNEDDAIDFPFITDNIFENAYHVLTATTADASASLDGVTVRGGNDDTKTTTSGGGGALMLEGSPALIDCTFIHNFGGLGAGVQISTGASVISGCAFIENSASTGGGVSIDGGSPMFNHCQFMNNRAFGVGAGVASQNGRTQFMHCEFTDNLSFFFAGAGIYNLAGDLTVDQCSFTNNDAWQQGGGIYNAGSVLLVTDSTFTDNIAQGDLGFGGGISSVGGVDGFADAMILDCEFFENTAVTGGSGVSNLGTVGMSDATIIGCSFVGNIGDGGSGVLNLADTVIRNSEFDANLGFVGSGAIANQGNLSIESCRLTHNMTFGSGGAIGANFAGLDMTITNCLLIGNAAGDRGGAIGFAATSANQLQIINSTFVSNSAPNGGDAAANFGDAPISIANSILWANGESPFSGPATVSYSDIEGGYPGDGNIDANPMFVNLPSPNSSPLGSLRGGEIDLHVIAGSPVIDAGHNEALPDDVATDLDGLARFVDDPDTPDTGLGDAPLVDMGAFEFQAGLLCVQDLDDDGAVGFSDLLILLAAWGQINVDPDFDGGGVGFSDLLQLLNAWGPCA